MEICPIQKPNNTAPECVNDEEIVNADVPSISLILKSTVSMQRSLRLCTWDAGGHVTQQQWRPRLDNVVLSAYSASSADIDVLLLRPLMYVMINLRFLNISLFSRYT